MPNKDQIRGRAAAALGPILYMIGRITGNRKLQLRGKAYQIAGKPLAKYGDVREDAEDAFRNLRP